MIKDYIKPEFLEDESFNGDENILNLQKIVLI